MVIDNDECFLGGPLDGWDKPDWDSPWDGADFQKDLFEENYRPLTLEQKRKMGLTEVRVTLSEGTRWVLHRDCFRVYILDKRVSREYPLRIVDGTKDRDCFKRFKVNGRDLAAIDGLQRSLASSGIFASLDLKRTDVALARLSAAVGGLVVRFDKSRPPAERLNVHHSNFICCDDRFANLQVVTAWEHRRIEEEEYRNRAMEVANKLGHCWGASKVA